MTCAVRPQLTAACEFVNTSEHVLTRDFEALDVERCLASSVVRQPPGSRRTMADRCEAGRGGHPGGHPLVYTWLRW